MHHFIEPLILFGEGSYALSSVKEIDVTDSFIGLDDDIKLCQNEETVEDCSAKDLLKKGLDKCRCTPYRMRNYTKEVLCQKLYVYLHNVYFHQESVCTPAGTECYKSVKDAAEMCVTPCKGLYADVKKDVEIKKVEEMSKFSKLISDYEEYKRGYNKEIFYPEFISSKWIQQIYLQNVKTCFLFRLQEEIQSSLCPDLFCNPNI